MDFIEAIQNDPRVDDAGPIIEQLQDCLYDGGISGKDLDEIMRKSEWWAEDYDTGDLVNNEVYRNALEAAGFDSIKHDADIFKGMEVEPGTEHIIMFKPEKIRSKNAEFDPEKADSPDILSMNPALQELVRAMA